jgi:hypothetical protein
MHFLFFINVKVVDYLLEITFINFIKDLIYPRVFDISYFISMHINKIK